MAVNALAVNVLAVNSVSKGVPHIFPWFCAFLGGFHGVPVTQARSPCFPRFEIYMYAMRDGVCLLTAAPPPATLLMRPQIKVEEGRVCFPSEAPLSAFSRNSHARVRARAVVLSFTAGYS